MRVKLLVSRAGPGNAQSPGDEIDVDAAEAKRMIEAGQAETVRGAAAETTARKRKAETTSRQAGVTVTPEGSGKGAGRSGGDK